jgi:hypothetical protein
MVGFIARFDAGVVMIAPAGVVAAFCRADVEDDANLSPRSFP